MRTLLLSAIAWFLCAALQGSADAQITGSAYMYPLSPSYGSTDRSTDESIFNSMALRWSYTDFMTNRLDAPGNSGSTPKEGFRISDWLSDHTNARFMSTDTHGTSLQGPSVEYFDTRANRNTRFAELRTAGYTAGEIDTLTIVGVGYAYYTITMKPFGMAGRLPVMETYSWGDPRGIVMMGWCQAWDNGIDAAAYTGKGCGGIFGIKGTAGDAQLAIRCVMKVFGCTEWYSGYDAFVRYAGQAIDDDSELHQDMGWKLNSPYSGNSNFGLSGKSCGEPVVRFATFGVSGSRVFWIAREKDRTTYWVCGFSSKKSVPDYRARVEGRRDGGGNRDVFYEHVVGEEYPFWEIVEIDGDEQTPHTYTGFFAEGPELVDSEEWIRLPVRKSSEELAAGARSASLPIVRVLADTGWVEIGAGLTGRGSGQGVLETATGECGECSSTPMPDSTSCADWVVASDNDTWATIGMQRQREYLPGRVACGYGAPANPETIRTLVHFFWCQNRRWNVWAEANGHPRRFNEQFLLTILGSPGVRNEADELVDARVPYDLDGAGHLADGRLAMPWLNACYDSITVPYTRIPARSVAEINAAYDAAQAYSSGASLDPSGWVTSVAGDLNWPWDCPGSPVPVYPGPEEFVTKWAGLLASPKRPLIRRSDGCAVTAPEILQQINAGVALYLEWSQGTMSNRWSHVMCLNNPETYTREQVLAAIVPSCYTGDMTGDYRVAHEPWTYRMLTNDPGKTRLAFFCGFSGPVNYLDSETWGMHLIHSMDMHKDEGVTWQQVVFEAQTEMYRDIGAWSTVQEVSNVGAPVLFPRNLVVAVPGDASDDARVGLGVWPNPGRVAHACAIEFTLPRDSHVVVEVFDVAGRRVATAFDGQGRAGRQLVTWRGTGRQGARVAGGVYFVRLRAGGETATRRIVLVD